MNDSLDHQHQITGSVGSADIMAYAVIACDSNHLS